MQGMLASTWVAQSIGLEVEAQVEMMVSTVQEGYQAIADAVMEKRTKARGNPTATYNVKEGMWDLKEDASEAEVRNGEVSNYGTEWRNIHSQCVDRM